MTEQENHAVDKAQNSAPPILQIEDLHVDFKLSDHTVHAVRGASLKIEAGKTLCIVGESGCGKSVSARAIMQLLDPPGEITSGAIYYRPDDEGTVQNIVDMSPTGAQIRSLRGVEFGMIFQEPMASMSPVHTIGDQVGEGLRYHFGLSEKDALQRVEALFTQVGLPNPARVAASYPFQLSGGMLQRAMIALALACSPKILIADEPTTALDVTTQAQILELLKSIQSETGTAILFITHDLGVVAEIADDVAVMYLGEVVETGTVHEIFENPLHPYTRALVNSILRIDTPRVPGARLASIEGMVPSAATVMPGCSFAPRCAEAIQGTCQKAKPIKTELRPDRTVRCFARALELEANK